MKKILITGITGFIGTHLALRLKQEGHIVYGITKPSVTKNLALFKEFLADVKIINCDISDYYSTYNIINKIDPDVIVHLAALSPVRDSFEKPFSYINTNIVGTTNIVQSLLKLQNHEEKKLIYASTAEVYGEQKSKLTKEDVALNPTSPYAITKAATDMYVRMVSNIYGLNTTVMRCTNTYGRKFDTSFFVEYLITTMLKKGKVYIGAPNSIRDYMYVDDHVNAYMQAIRLDHKSGEAFNFASQNEMTNKEVAFKIANALNFDTSNIILGKYPPNYPLRPLESDQTFISLNTTKAKRILKWKPQVSFKEGLNKTIEYWKKNASNY